MTSDDSSSIIWDTLVIGGGPAGSAAAISLAQRGRRVLLLEKAKFPRFHIGESLLPYNRKIFEDLGVWPKLESAGFMPKRGAQFWMGDASCHVRLNFSQGSFTEYPESFQVERSKFDAILLNHAEEVGVDVRQESLVLEHHVHEQNVSVRYRCKDGSEQEARSSFLIDASGLSNFTANRESLRELYPKHRKVALFAHFEGVVMGEGVEQGDIFIIRRQKSWFWLIPLEKNKTSVGLVMDMADFKVLKQESLAILEDAILTTPAVADRFLQASPLTEVHIVSNFSYSNGRLVSPRLVRAGDSSGFIDPIFSSGVLLAMASGQQAAEVVHEAIEAGFAMTPAMKRYEKDTRIRIGMYWEFIEKFYTENFAQLFFQPTNRLGMVCAVNAVLAGCTNLPFAVKWRLRVFFFFVWLNKIFPVTARIGVK